MPRLTDRVFLISGGARGLGAAQARLLVGEGAKVVIGDVLEAEGKALAAELGPACVFQPLDVTSEAQWNAAVALSETLGPLHGLVNNAGVYKPVPLLDPEGTQEFQRRLRMLEVRR